MKQLFLLSLLACTNTFAASHYTRAMFRTAMAEDNPAISGLSVSPLYVLITLRDPKTREEHQVCTLSNYLTGAITREYHLDYSQLSACSTTVILSKAKDL